jgi:APA family basic amino acid/polyamine antiporter
MQRQQKAYSFKSLEELSACFRARVFDIVVQGTWAASSTLLGTFQELGTYVIFTAWIFYGLAVAGVIVLRIRRPEFQRSFGVPGYPWLPAMFTIAAFGIVATAVESSPVHALIGITVILSGLPLFAIFVGRNQISV